MRKVQVRLANRSYDIVIGAGLLKQLPELLREHRIGPSLFLVATPRVNELYGRTLSRQLTGQDFRVAGIQIPDGEKYKNLETVENIYTYLIAQGADRSTVLLALGGGVTGDLVGFVAATYLRGIPYVQLPTTLLAQVDSSVGGKTGVNHRLGKNLIGAFYQPDLVCIDTDTLSSLPDREFRSGLYEVLKYGLVYDRDFWDHLDRNLDQVLNRVPEELQAVIGRCCEIKAEITSQDEKEGDLRRILNFGHTFGHALEAAAHYQGLTHGEAVAYGMIAGARLSVEEGLLDTADFRRIQSVILRVGPLPAIGQISAADVFEAMRRDKKRQHGRIVFVLLKEIGRTVFRDLIEERILQNVWAEISRSASEE